MYHSVCVLTKGAQKKNSHSLSSKNSVGSDPPYLLILRTLSSLLIVNAYHSTYLDLS